MPRYRGRVRRELRIDTAIALLAFASCTSVLYLHGGADPDMREGDLPGVALVALMTLPLVARRTHPLAVFAIAAIAMVGIHAARYPGELGLWPALAVYALSAHASSPRAARLGGAVAGAVFAVLGTIAAFVDPDPGILAGAVTWAGAWVAGDVVRQRRERVAELRERAERAERDAERERRLAAAEERTRIARDLHDSAGHAMNVILVQAGAARLLRDRDPERAREALETIDAVARRTIGEIERLVTALRDEDAGALAPLPGVQAIEELAEHHRAGGLDVVVRVEGDEHPLEAAVDRAAYRIVQEALTNAARHGDGGAEVVLRFDARDLAILVENPIAPNGRSAEPRPGHGLAGMRERAAICGGSLDAHRRGDRFRVETTLPYREEP